MAKTLVRFQNVELSRIVEEWQSGLLHHLGKVASLKKLREFESRFFRQNMETLAESA